jgi:hypothetical protein
MLEEVLKVVSLWHVVGIAILTAVLLYAGKLIDEDRRIRRLGGRAPRRRTFLPFGFDIAYNGARATVKHRVLEYFDEGIFRCFAQFHHAGVLR